MTSSALVVNIMTSSFRLKNFLRKFWYKIEHLGYRWLSKVLRPNPVQGCPGSVPHTCTGLPWTLSVNHGYHIIGKATTRSSSRQQQEPSNATVTYLTTIPLYKQHHRSSCVIMSSFASAHQHAG
jgi:hypothetical protein